MLTFAKDPLPVPQILSHARALAKHSSAPVSHLLSDVDKAQYQPWPTETAMRAGILFREGGGSMSGLGDIGVMGEGKSFKVVGVDLDRELMSWCTEQAQKQSQYMDVEDHYVHQEAQPNVSHGHVFDLDLNSDDSDEG
jgi:mediator of RNA polymerase II transcription subunit 4